MTKNILNIIKELSNIKEIDETKLLRILRDFPKDENGLFSKSELLEQLKLSHENQSIDENTYKRIKKALIMKKTRTMSGVTPVTVLTKPFPCPGKCIFCPNDIRMPKSYLSDEPGAQRAFKNKFDPYQQTYNRLLAYKNIGHNTDKIELIVLGGTWTAYPEDYQIWFIKRCFDAMNNFDKDTANGINETTKNLPYDIRYIEEEEKGENIRKKSYNLIVSKAMKNLRKEYERFTWDDLFKTQKINETAKTRCIGLVIETRPDEINNEEIIRIRKLGATKVQIGIQSLNDEVLIKNKRGHDVQQTAKAIGLLRKAGFKIHAHWMPNLYGSNPDLDIEDYNKLFNNPSFKPDELKIYPCSLIESAELYDYYNKGLWKPYSEQELFHVLTNIIPITPPYCRITRMIRDIGSQDIVVGNKKTNFRQMVEDHLKKNKIKVNEIRSREIRDTAFNKDEIKLNTIGYKTYVSNEYFLEYLTKEDKLLGFLRLSIPINKNDNFIEELNNASIIREIHVYGPTLEIGKEASNESQHLGLGEKLIKKAVEISKHNGFNKMCVISSIGTRMYYRKKGFSDGALYQYIEITS